MSSYIVRVELNSSSAGDFDLLHEAMDRKGFSKTITSNYGKEYYLPRATYLIKTTSSIGQVLEAVKNAVSVTGKTAEIIVAEYNSCTWVGLVPVK